MKKVYIIGHMHGNEFLGTKLHSYIRKYHVDLVGSYSYVVANPKAFSQNKRFIESDMNRSFNDKLNTYESRRAATVMSLLGKVKPDLVLDLHTTNCDQPASLIITIDQVRHDYIYASGIQNIVIMPRTIASCSLIGNYANAIAVELNAQSVTREALEELADDIRTYLNRDKNDKSKRYYKVIDLIEKDSDLAEQMNGIPNFYEDVSGNVPILTGNNTYKTNTNYVGFRAKRIHESEL